MPHTQSAIIWPEKYLPGTTDNFASNEVIVKGITAAEIWDLLADCSKWESYYGHNVEQVTPPSTGSKLKQGDVFTFSTFGFPILACPVHESVPPSSGQAGRIAWSGKLINDHDGGKEITSDSDGADVYHAWLVEDLDGGRVRVLTQESQIGKPCREMGEARPNKMLLGHQDWLDGLIAAARGQKLDKTNLGSI